MNTVCACACAYVCGPLCHNNHNNSLTDSKSCFVLLFFVVLFAVLYDQSITITVFFRWSFGNGFSEKSSLKELSRAIPPKKVKGKNYHPTSQRTYKKICRDTTLKVHVAHKSMPIFLLTNDPVPLRSLEFGALLPQTMKAKAARKSSSGLMYRV